ncbi:MAG: TIR domain-containing protein, partial [Lentisphaeria bacterium]|nr:TIR domain-containing protein [Lentisphaeria bacterium]
MSPSAEYKYYAFISYSRKNSQAAAFLHKGFERFRIPLSKIPAEHLPPDNRYLRPIFRDRRNLEVSENNFSDDIRRALETSKYLIVICSPEAAGSKWVEKEIRCFLKTHNNNLGAIIPIIFKGHPGSGDQNECLPSVLNCEEICHRNLPRMMPDEGETEQQAWQNGMIQAISYMLHVKPESIKTSIDAERIRFYQRCIFIAIVTLLIFIGLASWALIAQKGKLLAEAETARMIEIAQKTDALRKKAEENEKRAIAGEKEARRQAEIAKKNEAEAKRQAGIAKKNEAEAKRQEGIAKKNEAEARRQAGIAESSLNFLRYVFLSSDPTRSGNKDVKVIDAINAKIPEIYKI